MTSPADSDLPPADGLIGRSFGRYRILRRLGAGAMGEVYLADDPSIERQLAIKTVRLGDGRVQERDSRQARLRREAKAAGRLLHPNIVTLFDVGEQDGLLYLAFEYVDGRDLDQRLGREGAMSLGEAMGILRGVAQGLAFAHERGVIHRDIKPANILLPYGRSSSGEAETGATAVVKVSDFGIAKVMGQATELTSTGAVIGSPHYLSPEQVRGEPLDGRSDLFSLGVVAFEMLSGRRPFAGDTISTLVYQILHHEPPLSSSLGAEVSPRLVRIVARLLAKDRQERYASAAQLVQDLDVLYAELTPDQLAAPAAVAAGVVGPSTDSMEPTMAMADYESAKAQPPHGPVPPVPPLPPLPPIPSGAPAPLAPPVPSASPFSASADGVGRGLLLAAVVLIVLVAVALLGFGLWRGRAPQDPVQSLERASAETIPREAGDSGGASEGSLSDAEPEVEELAPSPPPSELLAAAEEEAETAEISAEGPMGEASDEASDGPADEPSGAPAEGSPEEVVADATSPRAPGSSDLSPDLERAPMARDPGMRPSPDRRQQRRDGLRDIARDARDESGNDGARPGNPRAGPVPDLALATGLALTFSVTPEDAFLLVDGRMIGRVKEYTAGGTFELPGPGRHLLVLRSGGYEDYRVLVSAAARGGDTTRVTARLKQLAADDVELGDLPRYRAREAVAFQVDHPQARLFVDGEPAGLASRFTNRLGFVREWLELPRGQHRVSIIAPGHRRVDLLVEITGGARERREKIEVELSPAP